MRTQLRLSHLGVYRNGRALYSEPFHPGVNIIHGDNGSGKSTIMDFIFFALGGDLREWKHHAAMANFVMAEVVAGSTILTLKREVSEMGGRPMQIFFGAISDALSAGPTQWRLCPYKREAENHSFSQILFQAIGLPEAISDGASNITMHQILRLLYGDQLTPIQRIFRAENFDTWQTRQAVGELMSGIGGYELYDKQIELRSLSQAYEEVSGRLKNLLTVAAGYGDQILAEHIQAAMQNNITKRNELNEKLTSLLAVDEPEQVTEDEASKSQRAQMRSVARARREVADLEDRIATLEYEIEDAELFMTHLRQALSEFGDAASTFFALGQVRFEFCPSCFKPVSETQPDGHCHLCGTTVPRTPTDPKNIAVRLDLEMQLSESTNLQTERQESLATLKGRQRIAQTKLRGASEAYELSRRGHATEREQVVSDLSRQIGYLDSEIELLEKRLNLAAELAKLSADKESLNGRISRIKDEIEAITRAQSKRKQVAYTEISDTAKGLLDQDMQEHNDFDRVDQVSFSFAEDWMAINGDKNRSRSASGMVVLKNSFLLALYLSSLEDDQFGLPRFMLIDNIEDKGMVQERAWNFQEVLTRECARRQTDQQIIFSTSKLAPDLDKPEYIIGRKYTRLRPSLEFAQREGA